jgi:hypothetical protein
MEIVLKVSTVYGVNQFYSGCKKSQALFGLLNRNHLTTKDLTALGKCGFDVTIKGQVRNIIQEMKDNNLPHERVPGSIFYKYEQGIMCPKCNHEFRV